MRIAITGTIGSGKTEAANYLRKKGFDVFDCDEVNRKLLNENAYDLLYNDFPECFDDNKLDKAKLSAIVFCDLDKKAKLESIMHPLILEQMLDRKDDIFFAEVPLLFEVGWEKYFDESILITCEEDIALYRLENRGVNYMDAKSRIACQMPVQEKIKKATRIIYNNGSLDELYSAIDNYLKEIC